MTEGAIVILGGAGDMGGKVVEEICRGLSEDRAIWQERWQRPVAGRVLVADYNLAGARRVAERETSRPGRSELRIEACRADARQPRELAELLTGARLVVNCIGPFYRFALPALTAALRAGVDYIDICDDDDATIELLALEGLARRRGVRALIGMGWTPGISNLLAAKGLQELGGGRVAMTWVGSAADAAGTAVVQHLFHAITRPVPVYKRGAWQKEPARSGAVPVAFPAPIGGVPAYYTGHPEPLTLPRFCPEVEEVEVRGYLLPADLQDLAQAFIKMGLLEEERKLEGLTELLQPFLPLLAALGGKPAPALSALRVDVERGEERRTWTVVDTMRRLTGIPPALAALDLAGRPPAAEDGSETGVYAPEGLPDPGALLDDLARRGLQITEGEPGA